MLKTMISGAIGGVLGWGLSKYLQWVAADNYAVRPELAKVDFWTAWGAGHGGDWIWHTYPGSMTIITIVLSVFLIGGFIRIIWAAVDE